MNEMLPEAERTWHNCAYGGPGYAAVGARDLCPPDGCRAPRCAVWREDGSERLRRAEAALAAVTKERDEAILYLRDMLYGRDNRINRCGRAIRWLAARDAEKEGK